MVPRVLHIDDEAPIRLLARLNLEWEDEMEVIEAADGLTGLPLAKSELPDLILLNVNLPGLDGWHVAEELRKDENTREIPVVFLTARSRLKEIARGLELGAVDYITKPFNPLELAPHLLGLLEREKMSELRALMRDEVS